MRMSRRGASKREKRNNGGFVTASKIERPVKIVVCNRRMVTLLQYLEVAHLRHMISARGEGLANFPGFCLRPQWNRALLTRR